MEAKQRNPWVLVPPGPPPPGAVSLVCFAPAGASGAGFHSYAAALPGVVVLPVELPGRGTRAREAPLTSMDALVG